MRKFCARRNLVANTNIHPLPGLSYPILNTTFREIFLDDHFPLVLVLYSNFSFLHGLYFTAGAKEVRAWTIKIGSLAPEAAGVIHSDFEKGFIRAEVISYADYTAYGSEVKVKEAGKMRVEGKNYTVLDGDVVHFLFNV